MMRCWRARDATGASFCSTCIPAGSLPLGTDQTLQAIRFGPDDKTVVAAFWGSVQVWDWHANRERSVFKVNRGRLNSYAISPNGRYVATGDKNSEKIWDMKAPVEPRAFDASIQALWHTSYSPDGGTVAAAGRMASFIVMRP